MRKASFAWITAIISMAVIQVGIAGTPACTASDYVDRCATAITVDAPVADVDTLGVNGRLTAQLTEQATGIGVPGRWVEFTAPSAIGSQSLCSALTDAGGIATCEDLGGVLMAAAGRRLAATFHGDASFLPSAAQAGAVRALGHDLP